MPPPATEEALIAHLRELPAAARAGALDDACAAHSAFRDRVPAILAAVSATVQCPPPHQAVDALSAALTAQGDDTAGVRIGSYKLLQKIGEGGFGSVWMAEQQEPIQRRVAVKIIKLGMDTEEVIARFEAERQALALMDHPNIARVFDAGTTDSGRPYFVMELVRGIAITRYCDENRLSAEARLRLFITVCQAVQHAHQKGVIHRDLKPSNILITLHDGLPVPKIIDFGIAKATQGRLTDKTLFTQFHAFIGTPAYTSPEQMEMSGLDVDTRSDVYSLGVLLYELLTGRPPFDADTLAQAGLDAMRRMVREVDPPRPSTRLDTLPLADRTSLALQRGTDSAKLSVVLRGDLDWIVMRCLEKDRTRRYDTPAALAADVQHHLVNEPVTARPPSGTYRLQKFYRRHKVGVIAAAAVTVALVAGLIASSVLLLRERLAYDRASVAEQHEARLHREAEIGRATEVKRAARTALAVANRHLADGRVADGLAYLVYAARKDPANSVLAPRLASALTSHNFALPESAPFECASPVVALRFGADGHTFMVGTEDGVFRVFDAATGKVLHEFRVGQPVWRTTGWLFAKNRDDLVGVRFQNNSFALYDTATGSRQGPLIQLDPGVVPATDRVGLSPDGRWFCAIAPLRFWLWDARTGELRLEDRHRFSRDGTRDFDFSPDGRRFSLVVGDELRVFSLPDATLVSGPLAVERPRTNVEQRVLFLCARFLPDSRRLAICDPYEGVRIFDPATGAPPALLTATSEGGFGREAWEFSPDGRLLHAGKETEIVDVQSGRLTHLSHPFVHLARGGTWSDHFNRDGSLLLTALCDDGRARLWNPATGQVAAELPLHMPTNLSSALSPDGAQIIVGTAHGTIHRLRVGRGIARPWVLPRGSPPLPLAFLPGLPARLLWITSDRARVLDVASGQEVAGGFPLPRKLIEKAPGEGSPKSSLRADLRFFVVRNGPGWEAWEFSPGGVVKVVPLRDDPPPGESLPVTFSTAGDLVAITLGDTIRVWDLHTGTSVGPPIDGHQRVNATSPNFSPDGRRLAVAYVNAPAVWDIATASPVKGTFEPRPYARLASVRFSPDGTRIVTTDRVGEVRLWETSTGRPLMPGIEVFGDAIFSPDGRTFVARGPTEVQFSDTGSATPLGEPITLPGGRDLRFSEDSRRLVAVSEDGNARVFDVRTAQPATEPMSHGSLRLPTVYFSPDNLFVRTETAGNPADFRIWSVPPALPDGSPPPEWLLQLGTVCAGKMVNDQGQLVEITDSAARIERLRAEVAALTAGAPLAEWGRWILNDRADRPIAPGFTITPAEADKLATALTDTTREINDP